MTYEGILLVKFPEKSFSTATGVNAQNPSMSDMGILRQQ
jgi:hypothetical protein